MGAQMSTSMTSITVLAVSCFVFFGFCAIVVEQIDAKLEHLTRRIGRKAIVPKVYGWTIEDLEKVKQAWIVEDPRGLELPTTNPDKITTGEQVFLRKRI